VPLVDSATSGQCLQLPVVVYVLECTGDCTRD